MEPLLTPTITLGEIYGPELLFSPRASPNARSWLPRDEAVLDMLTGGQLTILGEMPLLCAAGVSSPEALGILRDAGFAVPVGLRSYSDAVDYLRRVSEWSGRGRRIVIQHVHPVSEIPAQACWIPPSTLSYLNNKGNLARLVDARHVPVRRILPADGIRAGHSFPNLPLVIKAVTDESTGGGLDVAVCRTAEDLERAAQFFTTCTHVVVEEFIPIARNLCLNYVVTPEGRVDFIGCAEQVSDTQGKYHGNWIDEGSAAPAAAVELGAGVARAGYALGYWGCVGMDMAVREDGHAVVFDLNFRLNGSTAALLLARSVHARLGHPVMRLRSWTGKGAYRDLLNAAYIAMGRGLVLPLNSYDPIAGGQPNAIPRMAGLIVGGSRGEVTEREKELAALGLGE
jgi:hypothetical protein